MLIADWLAAAKEDAVKRRLPELVPLLEALAGSTAALRGADEVAAGTGRARTRARIAGPLTMPDLRTISDIAPLVQAGEISPVDLVAGCLAVVEARPELNAFITLLRERALDDAARAEGEIRSGLYRGPLHGIPIAVKDLLDVAGTRTTSGSAVPTAGDIGRRAGRAAPPGSRRRPDRQDQPARVRLRHDERRIGVRPRPQPAGPDAVGGRIERRVGGGAGGGHGVRCTGHRHRRVRPHPVGGVRDGRTQAGRRRSLVRGRGAAERDAGSCRTDGAIGGRRRSHAIGAGRGRAAARRPSPPTASFSGFRARISATCSMPTPRPRSRAQPTRSCPRDTR